VNYGVDAFYEPDIYPPRKHISPEDIIRRLQALIEARENHEA
jgi:hypothetical protein